MPMNLENIADAKAYLLSLYKQTHDPRSIDIAKQEQFLRNEYMLSTTELERMYAELAVDDDALDVYSPEWLSFMMDMQHQTILVTVVSGAINICQYKPETLHHLMPFLAGYIQQADGLKLQALQALQNLMVRIMSAQMYLQEACDEYMELYQRINRPDQRQ